MGLTDMNFAWVADKPCLGAQRVADFVDWLFEEMTGMVAVAWGLKRAKEQAESRVQSWQSEKAMAESGQEIQEREGAYLEIQTCWGPLA